jgi:hypothetical protein
VTTLYADLLNRSAALSELQFWAGELAAGMPLRRVVRDIGFSREHRALSGRVTAGELRSALRDARRSLRPIQTAILSSSKDSESALLSHKI